MKETTLETNRKVTTYLATALVFAFFAGAVATGYRTEGVAGLDPVGRGLYVFLEVVVASAFAFRAGQFASRR